MDEDDIKREIESPLTEDGHPPFSPAEPEQEDDIDDDFGRELPPAEPDDTHPATDSNIQPEEAYEKGIEGAAGMEKPNKDSAVEDYHAEE